jgi:predicted flap endonuclease-1-like 5' DNA nuclease
MNELTQNPILIAIAAIAVIILLFLLLRPKQRVTLSDEGALRPHMMAPTEGKGLTDEAAAAAGDVAGAIISAKVHEELPGASGPPDDLQVLKGVGPKLAAILNERGLTRYEQIAGLSAGQIESLDEGLGAFRGRLTRDKVIEQADYLARGDRDGFEAKFGKL